jgi:hypothetical protein
MQRQWRYEHAAEPPTRLTIASIRHNFKADGTVHDVPKQRCGKPCAATSLASSAMTLEQVTPSSQNSAKHCVRDTGNGGWRVQRILKRVKWEVCIPRLCYMPWKKIFFIEECSFMSRFNMRYTRMRNSRAKQPLSWMVQWIAAFWGIGIYSRTSIHPYGQGGQFTRTHSLV